MNRHTEIAIPRRAVVLAVVVLLSPWLAGLFAARAHSQAPDDPEAFPQRYVETLREGDFAGLAALMHDEALEQVVHAVRRLASFDPAQFAEAFGVTNEQEFLGLTPAKVFERFVRKAVGEDLDFLRAGTFRPRGRRPRRARSRRGRDGPPRRLGTGVRDAVGVDTQPTDFLTRSFIIRRADRVRQQELRLPLGRVHLERDRGGRTNQDPLLRFFDDHGRALFEPEAATEPGRDHECAASSEASRFNAGELFLEELRRMRRER